MHFASSKTARQAFIKPKSATFAPAFVQFPARHAIKICFA